MTRNRRGCAVRRFSSIPESPSSTTSAHAKRALRVETRAFLNSHSRTGGSQVFNATRSIARASDVDGGRSAAADGTTNAVTSSANATADLLPARRTRRGSLADATASELLPLGVILAVEVGQRAD